MHSCMCVVEAARKFNINAVNCNSGLIGSHVFVVLFVCVLGFLSLLYLFASSVWLFCLCVCFVIPFFALFICFFCLVLFLIS